MMIAMPKSFRLRRHLLLPIVRTMLTQRNLLLTCVLALTFSLTACEKDKPAATTHKDGDGHEHKEGDGHEHEDGKEHKDEKK